jgi:hypothetical protein
MKRSTKLSLPVLSWPAATGSIESGSSRTRRSWSTRSNGDWNLQPGHLKDLCVKAGLLVKEFADIQLSRVPRKMNLEADSPCKQSARPRPLNPAKRLIAASLRIAPTHARVRLGLDPESGKSQSSPGTWMS